MTTTTIAPATARKVMAMCPYTNVNYLTIRFLANEWEAMYGWGCAAMEYMKKVRELLAAHKIDASAENPVPHPLLHPPPAPYRTEGFGAMSDPATSEVRIDFMVFRDRIPCAAAFLDEWKHEMDKAHKMTGSRASPSLKLGDVSCFEMTVDFAVQQFAILAYRAPE
jgi:hypothetical protein